MFHAITDAYSHFVELHGGEKPLRSMEELREVIQANGLRYEAIDGDFWDLLFDSGWALGETDEIPSQTAADEALHAEAEKAMERTREAARRIGDKMQEKYRNMTDKQVFDL